MKIIHFCAGLQGWNGMANTARQFVAEENAAGHDSRLTSDPSDVVKGVDVVHIHGAWLPVLWRVSKCAKRVGAKLIIRPAGSYDPVRRRFHGWKKLLVAICEHRMLNRADVIQATCEVEADWIREYHPGAKIELTDLKRFFNLDVPIVRPRLVRHAEPLHVLYMGRNHPLKGVVYLREAVKMVVSSGHGIPGLANVDCIEYREASNVYGEEKEALWEWTDVLCLPTLSENFGRVVAEALEHGRPVITTDGAPAWADLKSEQGIYLKGYRNGSHKARVDMLKGALSYYVD